MRFIVSVKTSQRWLHLLEEVDHLDDFVAILVHVRLRLPHEVDELKGLSGQLGRSCQKGRNYQKRRLLTGTSSFSSIAMSTDICGLKRK